ncbi:hypothetical protein MycrhN_4444 [Mycolicibacterium rhodesiae NBB3]|uniref:Uncharacterized protein n=1 Tax=Mycolicibacterium rhodesiae (strain NBB3) TaxID=710685 RepID=G8RMT3_MYCRN|nr:hypothetical protein [Mycolicibacterium rhodesiae]AEV74937.1 hypothetical protein MycrhN_4444 [Mycolicibacterium rhodesiae NBB3]
MTTADETENPPPSIPAQADEATAMTPSHPQPDAHVVSVVELIRKRFSMGT